jgi:hypothetical protein
MLHSTLRSPLSKALIILLVFAMFMTMGCNMVGSLFGGGSSGNRELWSDVPKMDGMNAADLGLPLAAKLAIQAAFQGAIDYVAFNTDKTPADVQAFYTAEKMTEAGWKSDSNMGCIGDESGGAAGLGLLCFFAKDANGKQEALAIVAAVDDATKKTQVFFARIDVSSLVTPTP